MMTMIAPSESLSIVPIQDDDSAFKSDTRLHLYTKHCVKIYRRLAQGRFLMVRSHFKWDWNTRSLAL